MRRASSRSMRLGAVRLPSSSSATPLWSRSMRGNSCGISNGASLMSASFCCRCSSPRSLQKWVKKALAQNAYSARPASVSRRQRLVFAWLFAA